MKNYVIHANVNGRIVEDRQIRSYPSATVYLRLRDILRGILLDGRVIVYVEVYELHREV